MHDADTTTGNPLQTTVRKEALRSVPHSAYTAEKAYVSRTREKPAGWLYKAVQFCLRLFSARPKAASVEIPRAMAAERAAVSLAAQMQPPVAFKGDTTNTLVTPMGAYAGKPVEQAIRRRAEEQFKTMDISQATMN